MKGDSFQRVYAAVALIPKGKVSTYQRVAKIARVKTPRIVGFALHQNKDPKTIPCHRIVRSDSNLACGYVFGGQKRQQELLEEEGVFFLKNGKVDLKKCLFELPC